MDCCFTHANRSRNFAFLSPFFGALHERMEIFSAEVFERLGRIAYVPVMHGPYILSHSTIARPPQFRLQFWKSTEEPLYKMSNPILQLDGTVQGSDPDNYKFTKPIFVASFDALWYYKDNEMLKAPDSDSLVEEATVHTTTWWKTIYHMIRLKCQLRIHNHVETHDFAIEFYDNLAIAALVTYKWNTIRFWYWSMRFFSQFCFYTLVIIASIMQVYYPQPSQLFGLFVVIIITAAIFIWLELLQAIRSFGRYTKSGYNFLNIPVFSLPMAASIDQIVGGIWDPVSDDFAEKQFGFQLMMALFFFFTVILMLNVLIALINVAFANGDDGWRLRTESRLRYIESAENMSYHIPGFRQTYNYFPREIYFSATPQQVHEHRNKYDVKDSATKALDAMEELLAKPSAADDDQADDDYLLEGEEVDGVAGEVLNSEGTATSSLGAWQDGLKERAVRLMERLARPSVERDDQVDEDYLFEGEEVDEAVAGEGMVKDAEEEEPKENSGKTDDEAIRRDEEVEGLEITDPESAAKTTDRAADQVESSDGVSDSNALNSEGTATSSKAVEQDDAAGDVPKDPSPLQQQSPSKDQATICELSSQVGDLKSQVADLQKNLGEQLSSQKEQFVTQQGHLAAQLAAQQEQHQRQHEELKSLLMMMRLPAV
ncbi:hypothetical protein BGZ58_009945 [Dissophora ornata]|nr:hypothetical protein BGZ58_009945 [Dissophora ornata]